MRLKQIIVEVDDGSRFGAQARIGFGKVAGQITYFQSGASTEVAGFTLPIAEHVLELVHQKEIEVVA